jgi:hypothetical protein
MIRKSSGNFFRRRVTNINVIFLGVYVNIYPGVDGRIILRWIFGEWDVGVWIESSLLWIGTVGGHL